MWYYLFYAGLIAAAGAAICYLAGVVSIVLGRSASAATNVGTVSIAVAGVPNAGAARLATFLMRTGAVFLMLSLVFRTVATGHPPYTNMWEYMVAFGAVTLVCFAVVEHRYRHPGTGLVASAIVLTLLIIPELSFDSRISPLMPALQNNRLLAIHVALMLLSYSVLAVAFGAAVMYLLQGGGSRISFLPAATTVDDLAYRAVVAGFPLLAAGIALGAYWGNFAWGRYWGWDPKETTALVTWLVFAAYLHTRGLSRWRGARSAWLVVIGFGAIIFNIFAVNFWISGLHSYAGS